MELNSPPPCPNTVTVRRNPPRRARPTPLSNPPLNFTATPSSKPSKKHQIPPFPVQDILSIDIPQPDPPPNSTDSENLKVYLRIKPNIPPKTPSKDRNKNAWPQPKRNKTKDKNNNNSKKKKISEVCISVNDSQSVTLSPPLTLQESKRIKSVVYEGFSNVFAPDSSQDEVYDKMVRPLVTDFLNGKSGMIAALGPTGSGKTHTVFGTAKLPGMVPLALQHVFEQNQANASKLSRSFYLSIFEIYSEGGKGEKISDLLVDGADLSMQQSSIKGLKEIPLTSAAQAEALIASAMLKRATAKTNANSQSSRSQCIINIHSLVDKSTKADVQPKSSVLTVVDLAGAEREKRTGNQGSRLLESNFINNTSMVFGLCLRSLLEHQKNPKKPLQKHYQNSLLTRYLREYLEGKKRMALIITVKAGEDDYLDTAYLLRQASPYMKIKFNNVEDQFNPINQKRQIQPLIRNFESKRKKHCAIDDHVVEEGKSVTGLPLLLEEAPIKLNSDDLAIRERQHKIMQNFAKALWNVLKEYNGKLRKAEKTIDSLNENLRSEKLRHLDLEKRFEEFKSNCTCSQENSVQSTFLDVNNNCDVQGLLEGKIECGNVDKIKLFNEFSYYYSPTMCNLDQDFLTEGNLPGDCHQVNVGCNSPNTGISVSPCTPKGNQHFTSRMDVHSSTPKHEESKCSITPGYDQKTSVLKNVVVSSPNLKEPERASRCDQTNVKVHSPTPIESEYSSTRRSDQDTSNIVDIDIPSFKLKESKCVCSLNAPLPNPKEPKCSSTPSCYQGTSKQVDMNVPSAELEESKYISSPNILSPNHKKSCSPLCDQNTSRQMDVYASTSKPEESECSIVPGHDPENSVLTNVVISSPNLEESKCSSASRHDQDILALMNASVPSPNHKESECSSNPRSDQDTSNRADIDIPSSKIKEFKYICSPNVPLSNVKEFECNPRRNQDILKQKPLDQLQSQKNDVACEIMSNASGKSLNSKKPKRRLMPVSSVLLRDIGALGIENELEKAKANRGGKKLVADNRTQGNASLLRLLQSNLRP